MNASITPTRRLASSAEDLGEQINTLRADLLKLAATITNDVSDGSEVPGCRWTALVVTPGLRPRTRCLGIPCPPSELPRRLDCSSG
jgi:hypothetical protein